MRAIGVVLAAFLFCAGVPGVAALHAYTYADQWGDTGSTNGLFLQPHGVAVDAAGYVYVADLSNHRIQKFTSTGTFVTKWGRNGGDGSSGTGDGEFQYPTDVAVSSTGDVYVVDYFNQRVQKFTSTGGFVAKWGTQGSADGQFRNPYGIAVDGAGNVYVADASNYRVQKFSPTGTFLAKWGYQGSIDGTFQAPVDVAVDAGGAVYVVDRTNNRVQKFSSSGTFLAKWGSLGSGDFEFYSPSGIAVDAAGDVYVVDTGNYRVQKFTSSGAFLGRWGSGGTGGGQFSSPDGVAVDSAGVVYVADTGNDRIQAFRRGLIPGYTIRPASGYEPLAVQFTDFTSGGPTSWHWEFGDGTSSDAQSPLHVYQEDGQYTFTLTVSSSVFPGSWSIQNGITVLPLTNGMVRVEAEDYDQGGPGVAYHDTTHGNSGGVYRTDDVDIMSPSSGRYVVFDTADGEWTRYTVRSYKTRAFTYPLSVRVHASDRGRSIAVIVNGATTATLSVPYGLAYTSVNTAVELEPGVNRVTIGHLDTSDGRSSLEFDYLTLDPDGGVVTVPGGAGQPTDIDNDGWFVDVNGNYRSDFADVVLYFNQMTWMTANEPVGCFDYNDNGRIDFADVVWLFNNL